MSTQIPVTSTVVAQPVTSGATTQVVVQKTDGPNPCNPEDVEDDISEHLFRASSKVLLNKKDAGMVHPDPTEVPENIAVRANEARENIARMFELWKKKKGCDVTLICRDGSLACHKAALAAYSEALCGELRKYKQHVAVTISLRDFSSDVVLALLAFMYTTELHLTFDNLGEMLTLATHLEIPYVREACRSFFGIICPMTCFTFLAIAERYNLDKEIEYVENFMVNNFDRIIQLKEFLALSYDRLLRFITGHIRKQNVSELELFRAVVKWIKFRRSSRVNLSPTLMRCINLEKIKPHDLVDVVEKVDFMTGMIECLRMVHAAMSYHALNGAGGSRAVPEAATVIYQAK